MNIKPSTVTKTSFGKICWGTTDKAEKTALALRTLKESNDVDGITLLKYSDVKEQLEIIANHPDTFHVRCSILEGHHDASFDINVFEEDSKTLLSSFSEYFTADYKKGGVRTSKTGIKSLSENVFNKHKKIGIKSEVENFMNKFGTILK